jgi:hypothetical protein
MVADVGQHENMITQQTFRFTFEFLDTEMAKTAVEQLLQQNFTNELKWSDTAHKWICTSIRAVDRNVTPIEKVHAYLYTLIETLDGVYRSHELMKQDEEAHPVGVDNAAPAACLASDVGQREDLMTVTHDTPDFFKRYPDKLVAFELALEKHRQEGTVTFNQYYVSRRLEWGRAVASLPRIYLDTKFWIYLRDAELQRSKEPLATALLERLKTLVDAGKLRCPISYHNFSELMKQSDIQTRTATARIMDRLSGGATLQPFPVVLRYELENALSTILVDHAPVIPNRFRVWTRPAYVLGDLTPEAAAIPADVVAAMKKAMEDLMWEMKLEELIGASSTTMIPPPR